MTNKELKADKKQTLLGCTILLSIALTFVAAGATVGILFYKFLFL